MINCNFHVIEKREHDRLPKWKKRICKWFNIEPKKYFSMRIRLTEPWPGLCVRDVVEGNGTSWMVVSTEGGVTGDLPELESLTTTEDERFHYEGFYMIGSSFSED